jgi:hypothetical protein
MSVVDSMNTTLDDQRTHKPGNRQGDFEAALTFDAYNISLRQFNFASVVELAFTAVFDLPHRRGINSCRDTLAVDVENLQENSVQRQSTSVQCQCDLTASFTAF